jgi:hypothetical protein
MQRLTSLDLEFIQRSLGREPNKKELKILYDVLEPVLVHREKLPARFVEQLQRKKQNVIFEIVQISDKGNWQSPHYLIREFALRGAWPVQLSFIWLFHPTKTCLNRIHDYETTLTESFRPFLTHHVSPDVPRKKSGQVIVVGLLPENHTANRVSKGQILGYVKIPKPGKTLMNEKRIMNILTKYDRFVSGFSLTGNTGIDLRQLFTRIPETASVNFTFPKKIKKGDGLIVSTGVSDYELKTKLMEAGYEYERVGKIKSERYHVLDFGDGQEKKWPIGLTKISIHSKDEKKTDKVEERKVEKKKKSKKPNPLNVVKEMIAAGYPKNESGELVIHDSGRIVKVATHQQFLVYGNAFFNGVRSVANVVRKMATVGSHVQSLQIFTNVEHADSLAGQQSVIHAFGLRDKTETHFTEKFQPSHHQVIGIGEKKPETNLAVEDSDFISMLGSLKGELSQSLFRDLTGHSIDENPPAFDSTMEYNINQSMVQAISTQVIKKVSTISKGGLIIALLDLFLQLKSDYGMKIHISRKLAPEELLFGESFGSALVLIGEKELMEFQRICMTHGVPCSTIGRLQDKKEIKVNDILKIPEKTLTSLMG